MQRTRSYQVAERCLVPWMQMVVFEGMRQKADKDQVSNQKIIFQCETVQPKKIIVHVEAATE